MELAAPLGKILESVAASGLYKFFTETRPNRPNQ